MLVLTRKLNEQIIIGEMGITIKIVDVRGGRVRLGVEAPENVRIERGEIHVPTPDVPEPSEQVCS